MNSMRGLFSHFCGEIQLNYKDKSVIADYNLLYFVFIQNVDVKLNTAYIHQSVRTVCVRVVKKNDIGIARLAYYLSSSEYFFSCESVRFY